MIILSNCKMNMIDCLRVLYIVQNHDFLFSDNICSQDPPCANISFLDHGMHTRGKITFKSFPEYETDTCRTECENEYLCRVFMFHNDTCSLSASDLNPLTLPFAKCQERCLNDGACAGFTYFTDGEKCSLSNSKESLYSDCASCGFYEKTCQSSAYQTLLTMIVSFGSLIIF